MTKHTPYELFNGRKPNISYYKVFGSKCFVLNTKDQLEKFDPKSDESIFIGYSEWSKAYRIYNKRTKTIEETLHVSFDENFKISTNDDKECITNSELNTDNNITDNIAFETQPQPDNELKSPPRILKDHPIQNVIG